MATNRKQILSRRTPNPSRPHTSDSTELVRLAIGSDTIDVNIPDSADLASVEGTLHMAVSGYLQLAEASERLKPIIGRILLVLSNRRLYRPDYKNLTDYIERKVVAEYGMSRTSAFEALRIAKAFPSMSASDYQKYGATRLLLTARVSDENDPAYKKLLDESTRVSVDDFANRVKDLTTDTGATAKSFVVSARLPIAWQTHWNALLETAQMSPSEMLQEMIRSYVESHEVGDIHPPEETPEPPQAAHAKR